MITTDQALIALAVAATVTTGLRVWLVWGWYF